MVASHHLLDAKGLGAKGLTYMYQAAARTSITFSWSMKKQGHIQGLKMETWWLSSVYV